MVKLKRLTLTDDLIAQIGLTRLAISLASAGRIDQMRADLERVELADAVVTAVLEQSEDRTRSLPTRTTALAPIVEVSISPKRRRRA